MKQTKSPKANKPIMQKRNMQKNPGRKHQQHIVGSATTTSSQVDAEDSIRSSTPTRISEKHYGIMEQRKKMKNIPRSQGKGVDRADDDQSQPGRSLDDQNDTDHVPVGAFPSEGMGVESSVDVSSLSGNTDPRTVFTAQHSSVVPVIHARVVDEDRLLLSAAPVIEGMPMEDNELPASHHLNALLRNRKCQVISAVAVVLVIGLIVAVVLVTQSASKALPSIPTQAPTKVDTDAASKQFLEELKPLLSNQSLNALSDIDSPQSLSLRWLLERSNFQDWPFQQQVQRYAMATIYFATNGESWSNGGGNWLTNQTECQWFQGSQADFCGDNDKALQSLKQKENALTGTLPDEIALLTSLTVIDLGVNQISGTLPTVLGSLTALTKLSLFINSFTSTVMTEFGSLIALTSLDLSYSTFTGTVPSELGSVTKLTLLELTDNAFTGTVPSELGSLTALNIFDLSGNSFSGSVPSEIGSLDSLTWLNFYNNSFTGTVPTELGSLTELTALQLAANALNGTIPSELGSLTALTYLSFFNNLFTGTVPTELGSLTALMALYLDNNAFTGTIPSELGSLTELESLDFYSNAFNGTVPEKLCNLGIVMNVDCNPGPQCSCCTCWMG